MKMDAEKWVLSIAGGLVTVVIGYLVWRHENAVSQQQAAQNNAVQAANNASEFEQLQELIQNQTGTVNTSGASVIASQVPTTASNVEPAGDSDSNIAAILNAFFPDGTANSSNTTTTSAPVSPANPTAPITAIPVGTGIATNPTPVATPVTGSAQL